MKHLYICISNSLKVKVYCYLFTIKLILYNLENSVYLKLKKRIYSYNVVLYYYIEIILTLFINRSIDNTFLPLDIKYKLLVKPTKDANGKTNYIFAMTSLQPVDEAVQMKNNYYIYLIIFVLILIEIVRRNRCEI